MALSILNNIPSLQAQNQLTQTNASLQKTLFRLASGSKLNSGADDAAGLSIANGLSANVAALTQSSANASNGVGLLQTADGALSQVTTLLNRAVTLATEASTSTVNATQAKSLDTEFQSIKAEIDRIGGKTTFNNQSVFSATSVNTWTAATATAPTTAFGVGGETLKITDSKTGNAITFTTSSTSDSATTASTESNLVSIINASGLNVKASLDATNHLVMQDTSGTNAITVTAGGTTTDLGATTYASTNVSSVSTNANTWSFATGSLTSSTVTTGDTATLTITDADTQKSWTMGGNIASYSTVGGLMAAINAQTGSGSASTNATASLDSTGHLQILDANGNGSLIVTASATSSIAGVVSDKTTVAAASNSVYLGDGTATTAANTITTNIASLSSGVGGLGLVDNLLTTGATSGTGGAQAALTEITNAIASIAQQRGVIGASVNRLNAATNVINNQIENLSSAQNNISAADISAEVSNMTKYNVLTQTGISALSQSNQMQQALLKLLQ